MKVVLVTPLGGSGGGALQFLQHFWRETRVDDVVRQVPEVLRTPHRIPRKPQTAQSKELRVIVVGKRRYPRPQFLGDEILKNLRERVCGAIALKTSRLVNERNDADIGERAHQGVGRRDHVLVSSWYLPSLTQHLIAKLQVNISDLRHQASVITH